MAVKTIYMESLPSCDICGKPAKHDSQYKGRSSWFHSCDDCFDKFGVKNNLHTKIEIKAKQSITMIEDKETGEFGKGEVVSDYVELLDWLKQAAFDSIFECPCCGNSLEFDFRECSCGLKNDMPI